MFGNGRSTRRGQRETSPLTVLLLYNIYSQLEQLPIKPPVTICLLFLNIWPYFFDVNILGYGLSNIRQNCILPSAIMTSLIDGTGILFNRLILAGFIHVDESHLYYNMMSLCWKGINLELKMGSAAFLQLIIFSLIVSHSLLVISAYFLYIYTEFTSSYHSCAVGFSAVLFSLKYVWNHSAGNSSNIMGINVPTKYAAWLELLLVSILHPDASFIGHLCGILSGVVYIHGGLLLKNNRYGFSSSTTGRRVGGHEL